MELSIQYACSPATGDYGALTAENLATARLFLGNLYNEDSGVLFWRNSTYVPEIATTANPGGLSNPVDGLLEPTDAGGGVVNINTGVAIVNGYLYFNDVDENFDITGNPGNANAIDIIALRWTAASQTVRLTRLTGAAGNTAVLTQTSSTWDIPLAEVLLDGSGEFSALTDVRKLAVASGTMMKIEEILGDGTFGTFTFADIPGVFTHLKLVGYARSTNAAVGDINLTFNSDAGNNYDYVRLDVLFAGIVRDAALAQASLLVGTATGDGETAGYAAAFTYEIIDYTNTDFIKTLTGRYQQLSSNVNFTSNHFVDGWWESTNPITQIDLVISADDYNVGSKVTLYGIV